ncbi:hypothetical protein EX30DRAFT_343871 [Ascodesmis nigricans]|uniref:RTA1-domain-containing protein n=1 Tax=Ascodesmis nigricans TaxID=341454 RepID=A0A4S2MKY3_9PEZI|nr:hypothetical protein EX30DRAFT_343871 [Ascodesmis nigricans]
MAANETRFPYECNIDICPIEASFYEYRPSLALNAIPLAIFAASFLVFAAQCLWYRTWTFWIAMGFGNVAEILGYVGRLLSWRDPFEMNPFLIQIICLTLAPAFFAAGIYLSLSRIVIIFGPHLSRIKPKNYTRLFVACDIVSLVLQGAGGGIASVDSQAYRSPQKGTNIMVAGLAFQVFTLALFISLCVEFGVRVYRAPPESYATRFATLRGSRRFKAFLGVLLLATLCIEARSM